MKKIKYLAKKIGALVLAAGITLGNGICVSAADDTNYITGTYTFGAHESTKDRTDSFIYTDQFFEKSAYETDLHLAILSMNMAAASISSQDVDYPQKSRNIKEFLTKIGFQKIEVNQYYKEKMKQNSMGVAIGYKELNDSILLAIVPRSAGYEAEWGGNFNVGSGKVHEGFKTGRDIVLNFAKEYIKDHKNVFEGKTVKVWTSGYSRGAAVANLIGGALDTDSMNYLGLEIKPEDIYDYTFGTPANIKSDQNPRASKYQNIHNYYSDYDPVAMLPFHVWGFDRFGKDELLNVHDQNTKQKMLSYLSKINDSVYKVYTQEEDPDNFSAMTLGEKFAVIKDTRKSVTQKEFLEERIQYLVDTTVSDQDTYASDYQQALSEAVALLVGGDNATVSAFKKGASDNSSVKPLGVMLFLYNWLDQWAKEKGKNTKLEDDWQEEVIPKPIKDGAGKETGNEIADDFLASDTYKEMYDKVTSDTLEDDYDTSIDNYGDVLKVYKMISGTYMKQVLKAGLKATGLSESEIDQDALVKGNVPEALSVIASQALFGTKDKISIDSIISKLNNAATLIGNSSYMRVHNNEVILSWLRAMDTDPIDPNKSQDTSTTEEKNSTQTTEEENDIDQRADESKDVKKAKEKQEKKKGEVTNQSTKTGDQKNMILWGTMIVLAGAGIIVSIKIRRGKIS